MRVLDLFCSAGVGARGMIQAGATVTGVDIVAQKRYPGEFKQHTAFVFERYPQYVRDNFDLVWASPPCQFGTELRHAPGAKTHVNLIPRTRRMLERIGLPYIIENVEGAREHLRDPVCLCGSMFGLGTLLSLPGRPAHWFQLERHRYFECVGFKPPERECNHYGGTIGVYGAHARVRGASFGGRGTSWPFVQPQSEAAAAALGVVGEGLTLAEMSQGIPPAYARSLLRAFKRQAARK